MTYIENIMSEIDKVAEQEELKILKDRATLMGITFHSSIGLDKLREKVKSALDLNKEPEKEIDKSKVDMSEFIETLGQKKARLKKEAERLVRCRVSCMNPDKGDIPGEVKSVGNKFIGQITQYVPYNNEPIHLRHIILELLQEAKYTKHVTSKNKLGMDVTTSKQVKEFNIEILPFLTQAEIDDLKHQQAITGRLDDSKE